MDKEKAMEAWRSDMEHLTQTHGEQRAREWCGLRVTMQLWLDEHPGLLEQPSPDRNRWTARGFVCEETGDFAIVVIKNGKDYWMHFLSDYFEVQDRKQVYSQLGLASIPHPSPNAIEFATNLCALFLLCDQMEGRVVSGQWNKAMYQKGESPFKQYLQIAPDARAFDEGMDEAFRGKKLKKNIDALINRFPDRRRNYWQHAFLHIANNGDGAATQRHTGADKLETETIAKTLEVWKRCSDTEAAKELYMSLRGYKKRIATMRARGVIFPKKG